MIDFRIFTATSGTLCKAHVWLPFFLTSDRLTPSDLLSLIRLPAPDPSSCTRTRIRRLHVFLP
jgi:hypothetical protein